MGHNASQDVKWLLGVQLQDDLRQRFVHPVCRAIHFYLCPFLAGSRNPDVVIGCLVFDTFKISGMRPPVTSWASNGSLRPFNQCRSIGGGVLVDCSYGARFG